MANGTIEYHLSKQSCYFSTVPNEKSYSDLCLRISKLESNLESASERANDAEKKLENIKVTIVEDLGARMSRLENSLCDMNKNLSSFYLPETEEEVSAEGVVCNKEHEIFNVDEERDKREKEREVENKKALSENLRLIHEQCQKMTEDIRTAREFVVFNKTARDAIRFLCDLYINFSDNILVYHEEEEITNLIENELRSKYLDLAASCGSILKQVSTKLKRMGVEVIDTKSEYEKEYNPDRHITKMNSKFSNKAIVSDVTRVGFILKGDDMPLSEHRAEVILKNLY